MKISYDLLWIALLFSSLVAFLFCIYKCIVIGLDSFAPVDLDQIYGRHDEEPEPVEPKPDTPQDAYADIVLQHTFWYDECMRLQTDWMWSFKKGDTLALHVLEQQIRVAERRFHIEDMRLQMYRETAAHPER